MKKQLLVLLASGVLSQNLLAAGQPVGMAQMKQASAIGAQCSGFYDGVSKLIENKKEDNDLKALSRVKSLWPEFSPRYLFRQSTAAMLMTDIFIGQMNQRFNPPQPFTLQSFTEDYVNARKEAINWQDTTAYNQTLDQRRQQCAHILKITQDKGTLRDAMVTGAMEQRAKALGIDLNALP